MVLGDLMKRKQLVDLIIAIFLVLTGCSLLVFPLLNILSVKRVFLVVLVIYAILNLIKFLLTFKSKDYEGLLTFLASIITIIVALKINISLKPWNLAITLFVWIIMLSLIKLKKSDYYNDQNNKMWIIKIANLILFIVAGILVTINLYYTVDIQMLVLGFFFFINGILELIDPLANYVLHEKK